MKIKTTQELYIPSLPAFKEGEEREVKNDLGNELIARGVAIEVEPPKKKVKKDN